MMRKREIKALQDKQREAKRQTKARLRKKYAKWLAGFDALEQENMLKEMVAEHHAPKRWVYMFQTTAFASARRRQWRLYRGALKVSVIRMESAGQHVLAQKLEAYVATLRDEVPRRTEFDKAEWILISRALRPRGSSPARGVEQMCYSIYQHMLAKRVLIEGKVW
jgi:hypothetical protein